MGTSAVLSAFAEMLRYAVMVKNVLEILLYVLAPLQVLGSETGAVGFTWSIVILSPIYVVGAIFSLREACKDSEYARATAVFGVFEGQNAVYQWIAFYSVDPPLASFTTTVVMTVVFASFSAISWSYYFAVQKKWEGVAEGAELAQS